jgi:hypothetical protein
MAAMSLPTPFHTKCAVSMRLVARMPGCATLWMAWKTAGLSCSGTSGLVMPRATLHSRLAPSTCTVLTDREEDLVACSVLGQLTWLAAILCKTRQSPAARPPRSPPRQEVKVERSLACLPAGLQPETRTALLHRSPPREASTPPRAWAVWREYLQPRWLPRRCGGCPRYTPPRRTAVWIGVPSTAQTL